MLVPAGSLVKRGIELLAHAVYENALPDGLRRRAELAAIQSELRQ